MDRSIDAAFPSGALVISLDFELNWGVRDSRADGRYRANLLGARQAVPAMLELFEKHGIHATWATVGLLFCRSRAEMLEAAPANRPGYKNGRLSPYDAIAAIGADEAGDPLHYGGSLIEMIRRSRHQEIGSHTFGHYYALEPGQDAAAFEEDLRASVAVAASRGIETRSLVFPRNQVNEEYLAACGRLGIRAYRGTAADAMYRPGTSRLKRALRFADAYIRLSGDNGHRLSGARLPVNVPASRFLRPYSRLLAAADPLRLRRIRQELSAAARQSHVYHLWWHPHNFGADLRENLSFLGGVLRHFDHLRSATGMETLNMGECAARIVGGEGINDESALQSIYA